MPKSSWALLLLWFVYDVNVVTFVTCLRSTALLRSGVHVEIKKRSSGETRTSLYPFHAIGLVMPSPALNYNRVESFALQEHIVKAASGKSLTPKMT